MPTYVWTIILLCLSNVFMTFAWYAHLRNLADRPWMLAAVVSWGTALFEYLLQVPANRIGYGVLTLPQVLGLHPWHPYARRPRHRRVRVRVLRYEADS